MKKGFMITNRLAFFFALVAIAWILCDFVVFGIVHPKTMHLEPATPTDLRLASFMWLSLPFFLLCHIVCFVAIAAQFQFFRKASALRIIALILGVFSCLMILVDFACIHDIFDEYEKGGQAEGEWRVLYTIAAIRGVIFFAILANLIEAFIQRRKIRMDEEVLKDEVVFTLVHCVGVFCGIVGLFFSNAAFVAKATWPLLYFTFPFLFILTLIPYVLLAAYWLITKLKERAADWYDEKQFQDISKAGLISTFGTIPYMAMIYIVNYNAPKGPLDILWFPYYLYFVILVFSLTTLYFSWKD